MKHSSSKYNIATVLRRVDTLNHELSDSYGRVRKPILTVSLPNLIYLLF